ncbi:MAG: carbon-nitrogen hydrolase family protein [Armatimonadetes bacterium]|nr:carbon-nitrogen hydrolase family protein [Armatimonadota bacterium]
MSLTNLIPNGDFTQGAGGPLPAGWEPVCPNPALAPRFRREAEDGPPCLTASGSGREECFGYMRCPVRLEGGKTYRMQVVLRYRGMDDLNRHLVHGIFSPHFNNGVFSYRKEGDRVIGEGTFPGPQEGEGGEIRLYFRFSPRGKVYWESVFLEECAPIPPRPARIACAWGTGDLDFWSRWLDRAGEKKADIALLPEMLNGKGAQDAEPLDGPTGEMMACKARQWGMYVSGTFDERRGDMVFNTAPLFDRKGDLAGAYSKNQLFDPEEDDGATPGVGYPVFHTDFGRVGIIICYDSWFPEPTRLLAYKGAELVLFPNAGYFTGLMPARCADNGVWMAVSSLSGPAGVWDSGGTCAGEMHPDPTRHVASSILNFEKDEAIRMILASVDLSIRYSPHWWGGPMRSAPGGRRLRQTLIHPIEEEIARESRRWWEE